jgi:hypothetical protein
MRALTNPLSLLQFSVYVLRKSLAEGRDWKIQA